MKKIFIAYAHYDEHHLMQQLKKHSLKRQKKKVMK